MERSSEGYLLSMASSYDQLPVSDLASVLRSSNSTKIPDQFIVNEALRAPQGLPPSSQLPVVDLARALPPRESQRSSGWRDVSATLTNACREWGFCQVVNHGVSLELLEKMASLGHDFASLPTEQKERVILSSGFGYTGRSRMAKGVVAYWIEGLTVPVQPKSIVEEVANKAWPEGNPTFCETVYEIAKELGVLRNVILELLADGLGLETNFFSRHFEERENFGADVRFNYYPACPDPSVALGTSAHTDPTIMTILYQDRGDGLQVQAKDRSSWHLVEYKRGGLIIFINDVLQGWSNGVLEAAIHRAVLNEENARLSFLLSSHPAPDLLIQPATLPIDGASDNRPRYKPFFFSDYAKAIREFGHLPPQNGRKGIDIFAGIES